MKRGLYVDDDMIHRHPPVSPDIQWDRAFNFHQAIYMMEQTDYDVVSLDHDIASFYGNKEMTGWDVLQWMICQKLDEKHSPETVCVHSANPIGRQKMEADISRYWGV